MSYILPKILITLFPSAKTNRMIYFNDSSTSTPMTIFYLTIIFLCAITSSILNPTVFFYNKKKASIAALLFCVLSATDFSLCLVFPCAVLYHAATINLTEMNCTETLLIRQPQNCFTPATTFQELVFAVMLSFCCSAFITTGILAIVRSVQIKFPFYPIRKSHVSFILVALNLLQITWVFVLAFVHLSETSEKRFHPALHSTLDNNPFGLKDDPRDVQRKSTFFIYLHFGIFQMFVAGASVLAGITLYQQRNMGDSSDLARSRIAGAVKVFLTNLPSLIFGLSFTTPFFFVIFQGNVDREVPENEGWIAFFFPILFPLLSSVWNPVVFVSLTPKSRKMLRSAVMCKIVATRVQPRSSCDRPETIELEGR